MNLRKILGVSILLSAIAAPASAAFIGDYAMANWTSTPNTGSINTAGAPNTLVMTSSNTGSFSTVDTDFTITASGAGSVAFDWGYVTNDLDGSIFNAFYVDPMGYLINGVFTQLNFADLPQGGSESGSASFNVNMGDVFGFRIYAQDDFNGSATATISNFNFAPDTVPEPQSLALLGIGLAAFGLAASRRRRAD